MGVGSFSSSRYVITSHRRATASRNMLQYSFMNTILPEEKSKC